MNAKTRKAIKAGSIMAGILVVMIAVAMLVMTGVMKREIAKMTPLETMEVIDGVYALNDDYVNMYLVKHEAGYIGIDGGADTGRITEALNELKINPEEVTDIFLTHSDYDHTGGLPLFPNAGVYMSEKEEQMINGQTARAPGMWNKLERRHIPVKDRQTMTVGGLNLRFVSLPGHTPGSMGIIVNDTMIFTGDVLSIVDGKINHFVKIFTMDLETDIKSIEKLKATELPGLSYVFTGHHGYLALKKEARKD